MYMFVNLGTNAHEAAASQPLFSRAVNPAQRKVPLIERRKRKMPAALNLDQLPQFRRRNPKHARILTNPPPCLRVAKAEAGPYHTLHRCVDVRTQEVFFCPEYTGPPGEENLHALEWPRTIELSSPVVRSGADTSRNAELVPSSTTDTSSPSTNATSRAPSPAKTSAGPSGTHSRQEEAADVAEPPQTMPLIERRKRKMPAALDLGVLPPFKRRNPEQICVLDAPATHVRLHTVAAGPHHMMHQCIDVHTAELFLLPEYVGPPEEKTAHCVAWPQTLCGASKAAEEEEDAKEPFPAAGAVDAAEDAARVCRQAGLAGGAAAGEFSAGVDVEGCACASTEFASNSSELLRHSVSVLVSTDSFGGENSLHSTSICNNSCNSPLTTGGSAATVSTVAEKEKLLEEKLFSSDSDSYTTDSYTTEAPLTAGSATGTLGEKEKGFSCDAYTKLTTDATRLEESADESSSTTTTTTSSSFEEEEEEEEVEVFIASPITQCAHCASSV